jgi:hypothetical protein
MRYLSRVLLSAGGLVAVGAAVGVYAYFGAYQGSVEERARLIEESVLLKVDPGYVVGGEVTAKGQTTKFKRTRSGYTITEPVEAPGDTAVFDRMINAIADLKISSELAEGSNRAKFGLEKPAVRIVLEIFEAPKIELRVGAKNAFDGRYYVENVETKRVGLAEPDFLKRLDHDTHALRDKQVLSIDPGTVLGYETVKDGKVLYRLDKKGDEFFLIAPEVKPADHLEVVRLLDELLNLRVKQFVDDSGTGDPSFLAKYGLEVPPYRVTFKLTNDRALSLPIGSARDETQLTHWYTRVEGTRPLVEIHEAFYKLIDRPAVDLEDRQVVRFAPEQVARIVIAHKGAEPIELAKSGAESWALEKPKKSPAKAFKVSALIYALSNLRAQSFHATNATAEDLKRADVGLSTVTLKDAANKELATLILGRELGSTAYAMSKGSKRIDVVEASQLIAIPRSADEF